VTALMFVLYYYNIDIIELLNKKADFNANLKDKHGYTALITTSKHVDVVNVLLLNKNTDVNLKDKAEKTALMLASRYGYIDVVNLLLDNNDNVNLQCNNGWTAYDIAKPDEIKKLLKKEES
jgi:ankyrin repeat protein